MNHISLCTIAITAALALTGPAWAATDAAGDGKGAAASLVAVGDICLPLLRGSRVEAVAKSTGLKNRHDQWVLPIADKRRIEISPPQGTNPHVCSATVIHAPSAGPQILDALRGWAARQSPPLQPVKTEEEAIGPLYKLTTSTWTGIAAGGDLAISYAEDKMHDGTPVAGDLDQATLTIALTPSES